MESMRTPWTEEDDNLLRQAYEREVGGPGLPLALLERHSQIACRQRASRLGISNSARARRYDVEPFVIDNFDAAYLAGLLDGEGNIQVHPPRIEFTSTTLELATWVASLPNFRLYQRELTVTGKRIYRVICTSNLACVGVAERMRPWMREPAKLERLDAIMAKMTALAY